MEPMKKSRLSNPIFVPLVTLLTALFLLTVYLSGELRGNINWHFLPGKMFGVPENLAKKGITPLYLAPGETGWDGQFYYYISNDLKATPATTVHIDADAYRYQRVGLSLLAKIASLITFKSWVSPLTYYLTNLFLILLASYIWARYLYKSGHSPWVALFWSLGVGTQVTVLNGLPDAAADSCIIIALICYLCRYYSVYIIAATFAALSREIYLLVPFVLGSASLWHWLKERPLNFRQLFKIALTHGIPILIWVSWWTFLVWHLHKTPASQAAGILGLPLASFMHFLIHPSPFRIKSLILLLIFISLLILALKNIYKALWDSLHKSDTELKNICLAFLAISLLYLCFGPTVMFHYTGFMKAINIFFFFIPLYYVLSKQPIPKGLIVFFSLATIFSLSVLYTDRIENPASTRYEYTKYPQNLNVSAQDVPCLKNPKAKLTLVGIEDFYYRSIFREIRGFPDVKIFTIRVTNLSNQTIPMTSGAGATRLSYQWLNANGDVLKDGIRAFILQDLANKQTITMPMMVEFPKRRGHYTLMISLIQENCGWFNKENEDNSVKINYEIH